MAVTTSIDLPELIRRFQDVLYGVKMICDTTPTAENQELLTQMENLVEDLMDIEEVADALTESVHDGYFTLDDIKADLGL